MRRKYRVITYCGGKVLGDFETGDFKLVAKEYEKSVAGNVAVRLWINDRKLTYLESNRLFEENYKKMGFNRWIRKGVIK